MELGICRFHPSNTQLFVAVAFSELQFFKRTAATSDDFDLAPIVVVIFSFLLPSKWKRSQGPRRESGLRGSQKIYSAQILDLVNTITLDDIQKVSVSRM